MSNAGILILYHCGANTGYAIGTLEKVFLESAINVAGDISNVHVSYTSYEMGVPGYLPEDFRNVIEFDPKTTSTDKISKFCGYLKRNNIKCILGFDQPPSRPYYKWARGAGVDSIISYYGAPVSDINGFIKLSVKKLYYKLLRHGPDRYVFESLGMKKTATHGRGIPADKTKVCNIGVDTNVFRPDHEDAFYAHDELGIQREKKLIFYSGHFEQRKGISVIVAAANKLINERSDFTFVLFGNTTEQEAKFRAEVSELAKDHVVFGGYRNDLNRIHRSCYLGVIASVGWDSFTVSSIEMQSSGLPVILSNLLGLQEAISSDVTGRHFEAGDHEQLASVIAALLDDPSERDRMGKNARSRVMKEFSREAQVECLSGLIRNGLT